MPTEPRPRALWILNKLNSDLQGARMWPVRLAHLKHQDALSNLVQSPYHTVLQYNLNVWIKIY